ncbi:MAG TPA: nickel-type superoxide dismutase maturation protease [Candidatus Nanopelagicales bacterium]|nr:nickel-type superoxide dismutase maturation protease [Candidatus Nanopelagicales bacterium]
MTGLWRVAVVGASMAPTLDAGDWLVVRTVDAAGVREGDVVVVHQPDRPGFLLVKRAVRRTPQGWWVEGDNAGASDDSRAFGPVPDGLVRARVLARYWPRPRRIR